MENRIGFCDFRKLLEALENADVKIRVRVMGQPWTGFLKLILLSDSAMILEDGVDRKIVLHLKNVMQFEVNQTISNVRAQETYEVAY